MAVPHIGKWLGAIALAGMLLPRANHALFGPLTDADRAHVILELRGTLLQAAIALIAFRQPVGWRALYAVLPSLFLRYLHSMVGNRLDNPKVQRRRTAALLCALHMADMVWAHYWACRVLAEEGYRPLTLAFIVDIATLWGQLIAYTGNFFYTSDKAERYVVQAYSWSLRLCIYISVVGLATTHWYMPVHIAKDTYQVARMLLKYFAHRIKYRRAFKTYDLTASEHKGMCPVCMETGSEPIIKAACGHTMHLHCIYKWLEIKPVCPVCRHNLKRPEPALTVAPVVTY